MKIRALALIIALLLTACFDKAALPPGEGEVSAPPQAAQDSEEYPASAFGVTLSSRPGTIVSLSPAITEKLSDLDLSDRLSGVSKFCDAGADSASARCGTAGMPDLKAIKSLSPHLLLTEIPLSASDMAELSGTGAEIAIIPRAESLDELLEAYRGLAVLLEGQIAGTAHGEKFCDSLVSRLNGLEQAAPSGAPNAVYLRLLTYTLATGDTLENELMEIIGLKNIAADKTGWEYPEAEATAASGRAAFESLDYIYCDKSSVTMAMLEQSNFWRGLDAVKEDRYLYIDATAFERQTLRMLDELERMQQYAKGEIPGSKGE